MSTTENYANWKTFGTGVSIGIVASGISMLSNKFTRNSLGFSQMSVENVIKVGLVSEIGEG